MFKNPCLSTFGMAVVYIMIIMHTYFNFSFIYPVTQSRVDSNRKGGLRYDHVTDLTVNGRGYRKHTTGSELISLQYDFDIEEILAEDNNIFPFLETMQAMDNI